MSSDLRDAILKKKFIRIFNLYYVLEENFHPLQHMVFLLCIKHHL
jgi:hypothetical protein